jgi:hypothetical protein
MSSILNSLSATQLKHAVAIKEQIENLEKELACICGAAPTIVPGAAAKKRTLSPVVKAKIVAAQKERWAQRKA